MKDRERNDSLSPSSATDSVPAADPVSVVAIDGAAATGKTTTAAAVAEALGFAYVDSGAIYRAVALGLARAGIESADDPNLGDELGRLELTVVPQGTTFSISLGGERLGDEIRTPEVTTLSSQFAVHAEVRNRVREFLRAATQVGKLVVEGRDIGTDVFPDARLKVFLTADLEIRAKRRHADLIRMGRNVALDDVRRDLASRDERDSERRLAPLRQAADAIVVDTSTGGISDQVAAIVKAWRRLEP